MIYLIFQMILSVNSLTSQKNGELKVIQIYIFEIRRALIYSNKGLHYEKF